MSVIHAEFWEQNMTRYFRRLAFGLLVVLASASATAAPITYGFEGGSLSFGVSPDIATATGSFTFDTSINEVIASDVSIAGTGAAGFDGVYSVVLNTITTVGFYALRSGTDPAADLTGAPLFQLSVLLPDLTSGGTLALFGISLGTCNASNCGNILTSNFQAGGSAPVGANVVELTAVTSVPEPAAISLFAIGVAGVAGTAWVRRRRYAADGQATNRRG